MRRTLAVAARSRWANSRTRLAVSSGGSDQQTAGVRRQVGRVRATAAMFRRRAVSPLPAPRVPRLPRGSDRAADARRRGTGRQSRPGQERRSRSCRGICPGPAARPAASAGLASKPARRAKDPGSRLVSKGKVSTINWSPRSALKPVTPAIRSRMVLSVSARGRHGHAMPLFGVPFPADILADQHGKRHPADHALRNAGMFDDAAGLISDVFGSMRGAVCRRSEAGEDSGGSRRFRGYRRWMLSGSSLPFSAN